MKNMSNFIIMATDASKHVAELHVNDALVIILFFSKFIKQLANIDIYG